MTLNAFAMYFLIQHTPAKQISMPSFVGTFPEYLETIQVIIVSIQHSKVMLLYIVIYLGIRMELDQRADNGTSKLVMSLDGMKHLVRDSNHSDLDS